MLHLKPTGRCVVAARLLPPTAFLHRVTRRRAPEEKLLEEQKLYKKAAFAFRVHFSINKLLANSINLYVGWGSPRGL